MPTNPPSPLNQALAEIDHLRRQGNLDAAIAKAVAVVEQQRQSVGEKHLDFAIALDVLAQLYQAAGNYEQAGSLYPWALQIKQKALGPTHPDVAALQRHLGSMSLAQGQLGRAETYLTQALAGQQAAPTAPLDLAQTEHVLGQLRLAQGRYAEAESLFSQALALRQANLPPDHPDLAQTLHQLARLYHRQGHYLQAQAAYEQVLKIRRAVLPERHPDLGESLNDLAQLHHDLGHYAEAEQLYFEARAIRMETIKPEQPEYATDLDRLAALYLDWGYYDRAEKYYRQAQTLREQRWGQRHPEFARSVENLARLSYLQGHYDQANGLQQWAVQLKRQALGQTHPDLAASLDLWGQIAQAQGWYAWARTRFEEALALRRAALGETHPDLATSLNHLAELFRAMGDYAEAGPRYRQALRLRQAALSPTHPDLATSLDNLAEFYHAIADDEQAEPLFRQALDLRRASLGETHPAYAESLYNLATVYEALGNAAGARPLFAQALAIRQAALGQEHPTVAQTLTGLADTHRVLGHYAEAESLYHQARQIWEKTGGAKHPDFARALFHLAQLYHLQGKFDQAKSLYQWAWQIRRDALGETHPDTLQTLTRLAALYPALGFVPQAVDAAQQAAAGHDRLIGHVFAIGSERQRLAYLQTFAENFDIILSLLVTYLADSPPAIRAAFEVTLRRKALAAEALAIQREVVWGRRHPALVAQLSELNRLRQRIAQKTLAGPGSEPPAQYHHTLTEWQQQREQLEADLAHQIPEMNLTDHLRQVDQPAIAAALPPDSALVEFVRFHHYDFLSPAGQAPPPHYLAFVQTAGDAHPVQAVHLGPAQPLEQLLDDFRRAITGDPTENQRGLFYDAAESSDPLSDQPVAPRPPLWSPSGIAPRPPLRSPSGIGQSLRAALFDPLRPALDNNHRLFLSPDGRLSRLPFEVLPLDDQRCLIDEYRFSYLSVGREVQRFGVSSAVPTTAPLVMADPDFDWAGEETGGSEPPAAAGDRPAANAAGGRRSKDWERAGLRFTRLPGTRREGEQIAGLLGVTPLLAQAARESRLKAAQSPRLLHLATHGFFLADQMPVQGNERLASGLENPLLRSGLALAGVNTWLNHVSLPAEAEDGLLTAEDVTGLDLLATELVVLSACETGLGEVQAGEGVFGLRRAVMLAGAKTLVMSLWKVPDLQTGELMTDFYRRLLAGEPRGEALRAAQLALKEKYPPPFYWGAFICQGEPGPLPR